MNAHHFNAMGTSWWLHCDRPEALGDAEALVRRHEERLSRFRSDSDLSRLNRARTFVSPLLAAVARVAMHFRSATRGAFDPTLGAALARLGYDQSFERMECGRQARPHRSPRASADALFARTNPADRDPETRVVVDGDRVDLVGQGDLDLGGVAKGFTVDQVVGYLVRRGAQSVLVDGGGDIRGFGPSFVIGAGDGLVVATHHGAIATSSTRSRRWYHHDGLARHHILDPRTRQPAASAIETATVVAPDAVTADALATALIADPEAMLPRLATFDAHALVRAQDGRWWTTPNAPFMNSDSRAACEAQR